MAYLLDDANSEYLHIDNLLGITAYPVSVSGWFNVDAYVNQSLFGLFDDADQQFDFNIRLKDPPDPEVFLTSYDGVDAATVVSSNEYTTGSWHHIVGIVAANQDRRIYLQNTKETNVADSLVFVTAIDRTGIGLRYHDAPDQYFSGSIAEVAVWDAVLTDAEVAVLYKGFSPLFVRPQSLVAYWPLIRGLNDKVGGYNLTAVSGGSGPVVSAHPPIIYPAAPYTITAPAAVVGRTTRNTDAFPLGQNVGISLRM